MLNFVLLRSAFCRGVVRNKSENPRLEVFIVILETKIQCEGEIAITNENHTKYNRHKWTSLGISDMRCDVSG